MKLRSRAFLAGLAALALGAAALRAQGGPPMITDDPGTPGDGHWEINLSWTSQEAPGSTLVGLPLLDANYGVGDRIQLNYQASWNILSQSGSATESGMSDSQVAVKWRFYDAGETGLQISTYPRITFPNPGSDSDRRGTADPHSNLLLPFEVRRDFGVFSLNADVGHTFSGSKEDRGWIGGVCLGREVVKGWEVDAEVHLSTSESPKGSEAILNVGTRYDLSKNSTLLLAVGRDTHNSTGPRISLFTFAGVQLRY
jgi:Putative MetA-pathway of phenol degradation